MHTLLSASHNPKNSARQQIAIFTALLLFHLSFRNCIRFLESGEYFRIALALGFFACCLAYITISRRREILSLACLLGMYQFAAVFPMNTNHFFLEFVCLISIGITHWTEVSDERWQHALQFLCWIFILLFLLTGLQKLFYGTYFRGEYLAMRVAESTRFDHVFRWILPADEFEALKVFRDTGPYFFRSLPAIILSNSIWIGELVIAMLLLTRRWRMHGAVLGGVLLLGVEVAANEWMFGLLAFNLFLLYMPMKWQRRSIPILIVAYVFLLLSRAGFISFYFHA